MIQMNRRTFLKTAPFAAVAPIGAQDEATVEQIDPPFLIRMPNDITEAELEANRKWIAEQYANNPEAHRPIIVQDDVEILRPTKRLDKHREV